MGEEKEEYKRFTVSLPEKLYDDFESFRSELNMSRSDIVRKAMLAYMISEDNIPVTSGDVVGCITMVMVHEHFPTEEITPNHEKAHSHKHDTKHNNNHHHADDEETDHNHKHDHEYSSKPIYASVQQTDTILSNDIQHHFSDVIISNMHVHLEFEKCLEIIAVSGPYERVKNLKKDLQRLKSVVSVGFFVVDKKR